MILLVLELWFYLTFAFVFVAGGCFSAARFAAGSFSRGASLSLAIPSPASDLHVQSELYLSRALSQFNGAA